MELNSNEEIYFNKTTGINEYSSEKKKLNSENTESSVEINNEISKDNYKSIIREGIYILTEQRKSYKATMEYLLKIIKFTVDNKILRQNISDYTESIADYNSLLEEINRELAFKWNGFRVKSEVKTKNPEEENPVKNVGDSNAEITTSQSYLSPKWDKNSNLLMDDIEILNKFISSMDLNSPDEPMNEMDIDVDTKQTDSTLYSSLGSSPSELPFVLLEKITAPVKNDVSSNPVVSGIETLEKIVAEKTNSLVEPDKKMNLIDALKKANKLYSNMNRNSRIKNVKRKATDEKMTLKSNKKHFTGNKNDDKENLSSQQSIIESREFLKAKIGTKEEKFKVPPSYLPVVRLHRIKVPVNEVNSAADSKIKTLKTENVDSIYNLRRLSRKNNSLVRKKIKSHEINCGTCDKILKTKEKSQHVKKNFKCKKCNVAFSLQGNLKRHVKIHEEDATQTMKSSLKTRLRSYTTERNKKLLKQRIVDDSERSKYSCNECQLTFSYYGRLSRHLRNIHGVFAGNSNSKTVN